MYKIYNPSFLWLQTHLKTLGIKIDAWVSRGDGTLSPSFTFEEASFLELATYAHPYSKLRVTKVDNDKWDVDLDRIIAFLEASYTKGREFQHKKMLAF